MTADGHRSRRARWDERYREGDWVDTRGPAEVLVRAVPWLPARGRALDLACGAGRNALFLAERGLRVVAVDLSLEGLRHTVRRARSRGLPVLPVHAVLLRSTFPLITDALAPGGLLVFETWCVDEIDLLGGDIHREYALEHRELARAFSGFEVLVAEEGVVPRPEGDRGLARLIARKPEGPAPSGA
jgi:SAM-dependent methyltransferase